MGGEGEERGRLGHDMSLLVCLFACFSQDWELEEEKKRGPPCVASPDEMHVMGNDKNIHQKRIQVVLEEVSETTIFSSS